MGHGYLSLGQAVHVAQNSEGGVDQRLAQFLEKRLAEVWSKLNAQPNTYVLPSDEFALSSKPLGGFGTTIKGVNNTIAPTSTPNQEHFRCFSEELAFYFLCIDETAHERHYWLSHLAFNGVPKTLGFTEFCATDHYWQVSKMVLYMGFGKHKSDGVYAWRIGRSLELDIRTSPARATPSYGSLRVASLFLMLIALFQSTSASSTTPSQPLAHTQSMERRVTNGSSLLQCLQVAPPVLSPAGGCHETLMEYTFARSYGQPFVGQYNPPNCSFNRVTINFTVTSAGRQFDRLALMFLDDTEVFRTSTAEPTQSGIIWSYVKDMSSYLALFKTPQKIIFDLGNLIDDTYTGSWDTVLTATFFTAEDAIKPADVIIPISARKSTQNASSAFVVPDTMAVDTITLPQNAKKAVFSIAACGQATEEFWWSNVLQSDVNAFGNDTTLYGHSAFRELRVFIDGYIAGVAWPFPVIFTGGVVPGFWRPVVGIDAFDLQEDEIDITPFVPLLSDGQPHTFEIQVVGIDNDGSGTGTFTTTVGSNWVVTGKVFIWLDDSEGPTTGTIPTISAPASSIALQSTVHQAGNGSTILDYSIRVSRNVHIESTIHTSTGSKTSVWSQNATFSNSGTLSNSGNDQIVSQSTKGTLSGSSGYQKTLDYPLSVNSSYNAPTGGNVTIDASMDRAKKVLQLGDLAFPNSWKSFYYSHAPHASFDGSVILNRQNGTASYLSVPAQKKSYSAGTTEQRYTLSGMDGSQSEPLYQRHIVAANNSVVYDDESYGRQLRGQSTFAAPGKRFNSGAMYEFAVMPIGAILGRGPA
ncbi:peptide-N4-(N-acetyl-beta-glucosaminyl)asparagine amidase A [Pyrenophora seminiperda CCB06]|uniref:Peptide-N4-(N-acetyl-beta-glucosaminyl)asparagine amidase A n=1 Tax=Pyrenophora seminiperda CCB06 TaxID=1302712 RepID=A0A3M7LV78_9PLEO|nr:peptide-N4-(N-acetyl-beta-glucosaminyl)asparagine amidase A [Pyrenophora seminiperda CCB06]